MLRLSYPLVVPDGSTCSLILRGTVMTGDCGMEAGDWRFVEWKLRISILFVSFGCGDISRYGNSSAFQAVVGCCAFVRRSMTYGYECYCLSGNMRQ